MLVWIDLRAAQKIFSTTTGFWNRRSSAATERDPTKSTRPGLLLLAISAVRSPGLRWQSVENAVLDKTLAFDHASLVARAATATREEIEALDLPFGFLPKEFTLGELQASCEQLLGRRLDKSSFRRRLADRDLVEPVEGLVRGGAFRPAQLYRQRIDRHCTS